MSKPKRIQRKRNTIFTKPTLYCGRPSRFGNPFRIGDPDPGWPDEIMDRSRTLRNFISYIEDHPEIVEDFKEAIKCVEYVACWCKENEDCHVDILLRLAND